jgi:hypothetical protein
VFALAGRAISIIMFSFQKNAFVLRLPGRDCALSTR